MIEGSSNTGIGIVSGFMIFIVIYAVLMAVLPNPRRDAWIEQCQRQSPTWNCPVMYNNQSK